MGFIIGFLTVILVLDCLFLMLLILVQLPKKEAGMGTAFGGSTTDALFGSGTGNALTKLTKYAAVVFFVLALGLSIMNANRVKDTGRLKAAMQTQTAPAPIVPPVTAPIPAPVTGTNPTVAPSVAPVVTPPATATNLLSTLSTTVTNAPVQLPANAPTNTPVETPAK